jgi:hypothetical protein
MKHHAVTTAVFLILTCTLAASCGDDDAGDASPAYPAVASFGHEQGVDMVAGEFQDPGTFANSDLFAKDNGDALKLSTGGPNAIHTRSAEWFQTGGTADVFATLDEVPNSPIPSGDGLPLTKAKVGNGFIIEASDGNLFKGHILDASATSVTVEYEPLP